MKYLIDAMENQYELLLLQCSRLTSDTRFSKVTLLRVWGGLLGRVSGFGRQGDQVRGL